MKIEENLLDLRENVQEFLESDEKSFKLSLWYGDFKLIKKSKNL